jgi:hypothetical protein
MTADPALQAFRALRIHISKALDQAKLAYDFVPNSFTYSSLSACLAAEQSLTVLADALAVSDEDAGRSVGKNQV